MGAPGFLTSSWPPALCPTFLAPSGSWERLGSWSGEERSLRMPDTSGRGWGWEGASPWSQEGLGSLAEDGKVGGGWKGGEEGLGVRGGSRGEELR